MNFSILKPFEKKALIVGLLLSLVCSFLLLKEVFWIPTVHSEKNNPIGIIKVFGLDVRQKTNFQFTWNQLETTTTVYENDTIFVGVDSNATIEITNGVTLNLESNSLIVLRFQDQNKDLALTLKFGDLAAKFAGEPQRPLFIKSENQAFAIVGVNSKVRIKTQALNNTRLSLLSGSIKIQKQEKSEIKNIPKSSLNLKADDTIVLETNNDYLVSNNVNSTSEPLSVTKTESQPDPLTQDPSKSVMIDNQTSVPTLNPSPVPSSIPVANILISPTPSPEVIQKVNILQKESSKNKVDLENKVDLKKQNIQEQKLPKPIIVPKPETPKLLEPKPNSTFAFENKNHLLFSWQIGTNDLSYLKRNELKFYLEISRDQNFQKIIQTEIVQKTQFLFESNLPSGKIYWHVRSQNLISNEYSDWSTIGYFFAVTLNREEPPE